MNNFIDLTETEDSGESFSDNEDEIAFGLANLRFYKRYIRRLKHNDPNFGILNLPSCKLSNEICARVGLYLWQNKHVKNLNLSLCGLRNSHMHHLFGKIALQNETNAYLLEVDILGKLMANERLLVRNVLEGVTSFTQLIKVDISSNKFGTSGLDVLVKSLAGSPIEGLNISCCRLDGIFPLTGTRLCQRLKQLDISGNTLRLDDANTVSMLLDNGYPNLRQLELRNCGITDEFVEAMSPALSTNKSLRCLEMHNYDPNFHFLGRVAHVVQGKISNVIGPRGVAALSKAICDFSTFKNILASNHTVWKVNVDDANLFPVTRHNWACSNDFNSGRIIHPKRIAWMKYIEHYVKTDGSVDMSPFMDVSINLLPIVLSDVSYLGGLSASFKLWSCKMFRERISMIIMASQVKHLQAANDQLLDENNALKEQIAKLLAANGKPKSTKNANLTYVSASIGARVKERNANRKRGRNVSY